VRFGFDALKDFFAMHGHILGSANTKADLVAFEPEHCHGDVMADHYGFANAAGQYEHFGASLLAWEEDYIAADYSTGAIREWPPTVGDAKISTTTRCQPIFAHRHAKVAAIARAPPAPMRKPLGASVNAP
jgi:hypothetical protein